jgi:hypothetical protein
LNGVPTSADGEAILTLWGEIVPLTKNWRDFIREDEAEVIQTALSDVMARLGYEPYQPR